jgi:hypothetical protein
LKSALKAFEPNRKMVHNTCNAHAARDLVPVIGVMSTMISSPSSNIYDLLKDEANPNKRKPNPTPGKTQLSNEDKQRKRQEEEEQKKLEAALASQHQEESVAEGFLVASTAGANKQNNRLNRAECMFFVFFVALLTSQGTPRRPKARIWPKPKLLRRRNLEETKREIMMDLLKTLIRNETQNNLRRLNNLLVDVDQRLVANLISTLNLESRESMLTFLSFHSGSILMRRPENKRGGGGKHNYGQITYAMVFFLSFPLMYFFFSFSHPVM